MIHAIIVLYNVCCADSVTCQRLQKQSVGLLDIIVYDNSERDYGNRDFCMKHGWRYLGGAGNKGLSVAYNAVIDLVYRTDPNGYICLLDDDTALPDNYFAKLQTYVDVNPAVDIMLPILVQHEKIISPCREHARQRYFSSESECLQEQPQNLLAFNSGMTIKLEVYENYRYDERIFLDGLDHAFMRDMKARKKQIAVVPIQCEHRFSGGQKGNVESAIFRFGIYVKDSRVLYEKQPIQYWYMVGKRALHLSVMYKKIRFIQMLFAE
ncbi:MAG: glycosyltransferase [Eubacteriales bacterium]|nr:glycosyltransferase [Eubacteriales bacterium]